mmetsp:Transcript_19814/g.19435  ORF Transcript_19814/g.19435 Transcript_19814/m.19435 type:complete len:128 (+) Transcript_19814:1963-2346(+)
MTSEPQMWSSRLLVNKEPPKPSRCDKKVKSIKMSLHKKSHQEFKSKYRSVHMAGSSSGCSKGVKLKSKDLSRKKSSSSSPDIRTTPNSTSMAKKLSKNDFGYVNPKRKSYNTNNPLKKLSSKEATSK